MEALENWGNSAISIWVFISSPHQLMGYLWCRPVSAQFANHIQITAMYNIGAHTYGGGHLVEIARFVVLTQVGLDTTTFSCLYASFGIISCTLM